MSSPSTTPNTGSSEQPEEFPFENIIADFADLFYKENIMEWPGHNSPETRYEKLIWVSPDSNEEFKKTAFLDRINLNTKYNIKNNLDTLTQLQLAAITPVIHLYRRDYQGSDVSDPAAYKDRLFTFNNIYPETSKVATTKSREAFLEDQLRGVDSSDPSLMSSALIGIDYTFAGRNPVESERAIDVSIKMKFASFEALLGSNEPNPDLNRALIHMAGGKYPSDKTDYTDPNGTNNKNGITNNFLSLITHPPSDTQLEEFQYAARTAGSRIYYPNKFRVYLKLGWRILDSADHINVLFPNDQYKEFVESINKGDHDKAMLLNLINHELTFNEEGEVELKVNYIGSLDTNITSGDSDFISALYEQVLQNATKDEDEKDKATLEAIEQINKWSNRGCGKITNDDPIDKKLEALDEAANKRKTELKDARQNALNETYSEFLKYLLENGGYKSIKAMSISGKQADDYSKAMADNERPRQQFVDLKNNETYSRDEALSEAMSDAGEVTTQINIAGDRGGWFDSGEAFLDNLQDITPFVNSSSESMEELAKNKVRIDPSGFNDDPLGQVFKLVTVGSLLDGMLQLLDKKINLTRKGANVGDFMKTFYIVLGEYYYYPRSVGALPERLPLALLPINFDTFLIWFKDNIVTKQRKNYVLKDFLTDFFTQLVIPTLRGYDSNGKIGRQYSVFFDQKEIKAYEFKDKAGKPTPFQLKDFRNVDNALVNSMKTVTPPTGATPKDYNIIYVSMKVSDPDSRGRVFESIQRDREENISHFWVGDTKGMIKSVKFKRIEQPGLKEAKATKESFIPLNQLRDLYNTDISMFGNHYYYPGDMVFVHPQNNILGEPYNTGSISNIMGIGGYYDVIKVSSNIGEGGYETNLECIWTCSGEQFEKSKELKEKECQKIVDDYNMAADKTDLKSGNVLKK